MAEFLPNPERKWDPPAKTRSLDRSEVERRIGAASKNLEVLSGGLANLNVKVAEIHAVRYAEPEFLDPSLQIDLSLGQAVEALINHARTAFS